MKKHFSFGLQLTIIICISIFTLSIFPGVLYPHTLPVENGDLENTDSFLSDSSKKRTPMMSVQNLEVGRYAAFNADCTFFRTPEEIKRGQEKGLYPDKDGFAVLELPYKGDDLAMLLIAPNKPSGLEAIEKVLTPESFGTWINRLESRDVHVFMPKFKQETNYGMTVPLQKMGMTRAFTDPVDPNGADFTGMCDSSDIMDRLYINKILHKAFVEVNEKGTEAVAATAVMMPGPALAPIKVPFTPTFRADRPFLFLIRDRVTNSILFMGRIVDPAV